MPIAQLAELQAAASRHFEGVLTPAGRDYDFVQAFWLVAFDGNLNAGGGWLSCARMLKLVLCQRKEGFWDASTSVAFALLARQQSEIDELPDTLMDRVKGMFGKLAEAEKAMESAVTGPGDSAMDDVAEPTAERGTAVEEAALKKRQQESLEALRLSSGRKDLTWKDVQSEASSEVTDCPLTFSLFALKETLPLELASLGAEARPLEVWSTMCCLAMLERFKISWIFGDGDLYAQHEVTIVDAAQSWIDSCCEQLPALAAVMAEHGKELHDRARKLTITWQRAWLHRVKLLRKEEALTFKMSTDQAERAGKALAQAVMTQHDTMAAFLAPAGSFKRWQQFFIIITLVRG